jgi:hypothetical protein
MRAQILFATVILCVLAAVPAGAQIFTPSYLAPRASSDVGIHLANGVAEGGGLAVEGIWRRGFGGYDLGLRTGVAEIRDAAALLVGGDYRRPLALAAQPLIFAATGGAQAAIGRDSGFGVDVGLSIGSTFPLEGASITPYLHPRVALVSGPVRDELRLRLLADAGFEFAIADGLLLRLALGFGGPTSDFGIGLAWR